MTHVLLANLVFFIVPVCGAAGFAIVIQRILRQDAPPAPPSPDGGSKVPLPSAGPNDLARSA